MARTYPGASDAALILAPMDGVTDPLMRECLTSFQPYTYCVTEFIRVNHEAPPAKVFHRDVPELLHGSRTVHGVPVQVQLLGGDPERMAQAASTVVRCGATGIDLNFGCPAPTVNRHDGGAILLKFPDRIERIVRTVRDAVPSEVPVSAKLRLGWDDRDTIYENAERAAAGGASWITIHGRTKSDGYKPPAYWGPIGRVRALIDIPVVANGEIWTVEDLRRCRDETGCSRFMIGRGALARPWEMAKMATFLGLDHASGELSERDEIRPWLELFHMVVSAAERYSVTRHGVLSRLKQWLRLAEAHAGAPWFQQVKRCGELSEFLEALSRCDSRFESHPGETAVGGAREPSQMNAAL